MTAAPARPEPLVPLDTDITGLPAFMLDVERLFASELWALSTGEEFKAAVALWGRAWQQTPAGSLPNDDRLLAAFSGAGPRWRKVKAMALRGFVLCADDRYYHRVLCLDVLRAAKNKEDRRQRTAAASKARRERVGDEPTPPDGGKKANSINETVHRNDGRDGQRNEGRHDDRNDARHEVRHEQRSDTVTATVTSSHRQDRTGQDSRIDSTPPTPRDPVPRAAGRPGGGWASRANFDRVEGRCRSTIPGGGPLDPQIGPIARLEADGLDLEAEILPALLDIAAASRAPIRTWRLYADRIAERIAAQRQARQAQGLAPTPTAPTPPEELVDLGASGRHSEATVRTMLARFRSSPGTWIEGVFGPPPGQPGCRIPARLLVAEAA